MSLSYNNELIHYGILFIAIPVSIYALVTGVRNHNSYNYLYLGLLGTLTLILAVTLGAQIWGEAGEKILTTIGALLVLSHTSKTTGFVGKLSAILVIKFIN